MLAIGSKDARFLFKRWGPRQISSTAVPGLPPPHAHKDAIEHAVVALICRCGSRKSMMDVLSPKDPKRTSDLPGNGHSCLRSRTGHSTGRWIPRSEPPGGTVLFDRPWKSEVLAILDRLSHLEPYSLPGGKKLRSTDDERAVTFVRAGTK